MIIVQTTSRAGFVGGRKFPIIQELFIIMLVLIFLMIRFYILFPTLFLSCLSISSFLSFITSAFPSFPFLSLPFPSFLLVYFVRYCVLSCYVFVSFLCTCLCLLSFSSVFFLDFFIIALLFDYLLLSFSMCFFACLYISLFRYVVLS